MPMPSIEEIFQDVEHGRIDYGIVPVENSIEGSVTSALDSFMKYSVKICGEVNLAIKHNLVNYSGNIEDIQTVVSHSQPLAQCQELAAQQPARGPDPVPSFQHRHRRPDGQADHPMAAPWPATWPSRPMNCRWWPGDRGLPGNTTRFLVIGKTSPST